MNKQLIKLCLASILSLSLNTNLQAQGLDPAIPVMPEITVTEDISSKVENFIQEALKIYPTIEVKFSAQDGELAFSKSPKTSVQNIDLIFDLLDNQEWIDSLKSFKMINVYFDPNSSLLTSILTKMHNLQSLILNNTKLGSMQYDRFELFANTLSKLNNLQILNLKFNDLGGKLALLTPAIDNMTDLQVLNLGRNELGAIEDDDFNTFANALSSKTNLQILNLKFNDLGGKLALLAPAINNMTNLQVLNLGRNELGAMAENEFTAFANTLSSKTKLQTLVLAFNDLGGRLATLAPAIANMTDLQTLSLAGNELGLMDESDLTIFANALSKLTKLQSLNLNGNDLQNGAVILATAIANMTDLHDLFWGNNCLGMLQGADINTFANDLSKLTKLQTLFLEGNNLQNGAAIIAQAIVNMTDLQELSLLGNKLGSMDENNFNTFANALSQLINLQTLSLGITELGKMNKNGLNTLASALSVLTKLETLDLGYNNLDKKFAILAPAVVKMTDLRALGLVGNNLGSMEDNDFNTFASDLSKLTKLQTLFLHHNGLGGRVAILAPAIANMTDLHELGLCFNKLGSMGEKELNTVANALSTLTKLQRLDLNGNNLGENSALLVSAVANTNNLQILRLTDNKIGSMGKDPLNTLVNALSKLTSLQELNFGDSELGAMDKNGIHALANALSKLTELQILDLTWNSFGQNFALLAPAFANMTNLQTLILHQANLAQMQADGWQTFTTLLSYTTNLRYLGLAGDHIEASTLNAFIESILQTESIAGIPNLTHYSDLPRDANHTLEINFSNSQLLDGEYEELQDALSAFNPAIKVTFK